MKNFEKYKNQNDLIKAFFKNRSQSSIGVAIVEEFVKWREMEAEEDEILPCPSCGCHLVSIVYDATSPMSYSVKCCCGYSSERTPDKSLTISKHNRVARGAMKSDKLN